jgi:hypothetical protein
VQGVEQWRQEIAIQKNTLEWKRQMWALERNHLEEEILRLERTVKQLTKKCEKMLKQKQEYHNKYNALVNHVTLNGINSDMSPKRKHVKVNGDNNNDDTQIDESPNAPKNKRIRSNNSTVSLTASNIMNPETKHDSHENKEIISPPPLLQSKTSFMDITSINVEDDDDCEERKGQEQEKHMFTKYVQHKNRTVKIEPESVERSKPRRTFTVPKPTSLFESPPDAPTEEVVLIPPPEVNNDLTNEYTAEDEDEEFEFKYVNGVNKLQKRDITLSEISPTKKRKHSSSKQHKKKKRGSDTIQQKEESFRPKKKKETSNSTSAQEPVMETEKIYIEETVEQQAIRTAPICQHKSKKLSRTEVEGREKEKFQVEIKNRMSNERRSGKSIMHIVKQKKTTNETTDEKANESDSDIEDIRKYFSNQQTPEQVNQKFKYQEVVRKKSDREKLPAHECDECKAFMDAIGDGMFKSDEERKKIVQRCSRHRSVHEPPAVPDFFWKIDKDTDNDCMNNDEDDSPVPERSYYSASIQNIKSYHTTSLNQPSAQQSLTF